MEPLISIITINYNNLNGIRKTMESVFAQTFKDYEYIIIDGASTDGSALFISQYSQELAFWCSQKDSGIYNAMNKGILHARGAYCFFLNSGDYLSDKDSLNRLISLNNGADIIYGNIFLLKAHGPIFVKGLAKEEFTLFDFYKETIFHPATLIKRSLFKKYGLYDENYSLTSDWKFFMETIIIHKVQVQYIDTSVSCYDMNGISTINYQKGEFEKKMILLSYWNQSIIKDYEHFSEIDYKYGRLWKYSVTRNILHYLNALVYRWENWFL